MNPLVSEFIGTFLLILMGTGANAANTLNKSYAQNTGWVFVTFGWGLAVFVAVIVAGPSSGAHINPAVTIGLATAGLFPWAEAPGYILAQLGGAMLGALVAWITYYKQYLATDDPGAKLGTFATGPAIAHAPSNFFSELIGTFVLIFVILYIAGPIIEADNLQNAKIGLGSIGALPVALLVVVVGMSLGSTTGYAINPARDLGPRIVHALVPMPKGDSNWGYAWIPVLGPVAGALIAAGIYMAVQ